MKIGLITLSRIETKQNQFYNAQDMGLARALAGKGHEVTVYRLTGDITQETEADGIRVIARKTCGFGRQSLCHFHFLDTQMERLICFSDNQVTYPALAKWCGRHKVLLLPYVGVIHSNSSRRMVQLITDTMMERNLKCYRRQRVYGKTPDILRRLQEKGCRDTELVPVCLDLERLKEDYDTCGREKLRRDLGFGKDERILLYIGRLEPEKEPLEMLQILSDLLRQDNRFRLIMVGKGSLEEEVRGRTEKEPALKNKVLLLPQVPNQDIWKYYRASDCFVNLNHHEIYGMSILEALYYNCPVVAWSAPGPEFILNGGEAGRLGDNQAQIAEAVREICRGQGRVQTREYLMERLSWDKVCGRFTE